jgi:PAS domain-containing protein
VAAADGDVVLAEKKVVAAEAALDSMTARVAADRARVSQSDAGMIDELSRAAGSVERQHTVLKTEIAVLEAEQKVAAAQRAAKPEDAKSKEALTKAEKELEEAREKQSEAQAALDKTDDEYTPFGTQYPQSSTGRRLALAQWIVARDNPLAARVAVNHLWLRHFGTPLVTETFDFGLRSPAPVHQDLLDWLAVELMESGWSMKHLHRLIVTSRTYRAESGERRVESGGSRVEGREPRAAQLDKDNAYHWRANVRRLDAEVVRDSVLYVGGSLDLTRGGPDIDFTDGEKVPRRSLYFRHAYEKQMRFLVLFDEASPNECYRRTESIVPQQALALANSALSLGQSRKLARTLAETLQEAADGDGAFVSAAFEQVLCRPPSEEELAACREFLMQQREQLADTKSLSGFEGAATADVPPSDDPALRARENLVHVLMNHNDFVTVR